MQQRFAFILLGVGGALMLANIAMRLQSPSCSTHPERLQARKTRSLEQERGSLRSENALWAAWEARNAQAAMTPAGVPASWRVAQGLCPPRPRLDVLPGEPPRYYAFSDMKRFTEEQYKGPSHVPLLALHGNWLEERGWTETQDVRRAEVVLKVFRNHDARPSPFRLALPSGEVPLVSCFPPSGPNAGEDPSVCRVHHKFSITDCLLRAHEAAPAAGLADFIPPTFNFPAAIGQQGVPADMEARFRELFERVNAEAVATPGGTPAWLVKPGAVLSGGKGIELVTGADAALAKAVRLSRESKQSMPVQVQKVLDNPLLINGRRFDLRVHVLVASREPLVLYWNPNATAVRIAQPAAGAPSATRSTVVTNFAVHRGRPVDEHLWLLEQVLAHLRQLGPDKERLFWERTVPGIKRALRGVMSLDTYHVHRRRSFHIWGCDFMIGSDMRPWFIECNGFPSVFQFMPRLRPRQLRMIQDTLEIAMSAPNCVYEGSSWDLVHDGLSAPVLEGQAPLASALQS